MNKQSQIKQAIARISNGSSIMVGGFGSPGTPFSLINELLSQGQKNLTLIKNDANESSIGISKLIENGQVDKLITSHIGLNKIVIDMMNSKTIEVEFYPQGILAEKIRIAGSGCYGFLSDVGIDTEITDNKQLIEWQGKQLKVESALYADFALIHAKQSDCYGNLVYGASAMNFSPLMAMAATEVIVETPKIVAAGEIAPEQVHTPSAFVDSIVLLEKLTEDYQLLEAHLER
ncbi:MAG: CoA transferase subunit A [Gammaproteobacteria bacterium]|nr:MAG: CoA transferase subunit A [Gammaproteobacteria bacterium]